MADAAGLRARMHIIHTYICTEVHTPAVGVNSMFCFITSFIFEYCSGAFKRLPTNRNLIVSDTPHQNTFSLEMPNRLQKYKLLCNHANFS